MTPSLTQTELLILVAMARLGDEAYGVTISAEITECTERRVSLAAIYAALDRLDQQGLVGAWLSAPLPERGGRARRHYALTADGRALVRRERANALRMWRGVSLEPGSGHR